MAHIVDTLTHYFEHFHEHTDALRTDLPLGWSSLVGVAGASLIAATGYSMGKRAVKKRKRILEESNDFPQAKRQELDYEYMEDDVLSTCSSKQSDSSPKEYHINKVHQTCIQERRRRETIVHKHGGVFIPIDGGHCYVQIRDPIDQTTEDGYYPTDDQLIQLNYLDQSKIVVIIPGHNTLYASDSLSSITLFDKLASHLNQRGYRVVLFDFLGRGYSSTCPHLSHTVDSYVSQMRQIMEHLRLDEQQINIIACSSSTKIALHYTHLFERCQDEAHVTKLVLVSPVGFEFSRKISIRRTATNLLRKPWFLSFVNKFRDLDKMMLRRLTLGFAHRDHPSIQVIKSRFEEAKQDPNWRQGAVKKLVDFGLNLSNEVDEDLIALKNIAAGSDIEYENCQDKDEMIHALEVKHFPEEPLPVLLLWGRKDHIVMRSDLTPFSKYLPHAKVEIFEEAGHCLLFEEEQLVYNSIVQFL